MKTNYPQKLFSFLKAYDGDDSMPLTNWLAQLKKGVITYNEKNSTFYKPNFVMSAYMNWDAKRRMHQ